MRAATVRPVCYAVLCCLLAANAWQIPVRTQADEVPLYRRATETYPDELVRYATQQPRPPQPPLPRDPDDGELQPPPRVRDSGPVAAPPPQRTFRRSYFRLASVPNMFGDTFAQGGQLLVTKPGFAGFTDLPLAGGARRNKIAENGTAMPEDRVFVMYNHFNNALDFGFDTVDLPPGVCFLSSISSFDVERYLVGVEKTFFDHRASVEVRMPFTNRFAPVGGPAQFAAFGGNVGNLTINFKGVLYGDACSVYAAGLGIDLPTGSDVTGFAQTEAFRIRNEAVHLMPFVGFLHAPDDCWFYHGFAQADIATGPNTFESTPAFGGLGAGLETVDQSLLYLDLSAGRWLFRNQGNSSGLTGLAAVAELHYTTTLENSNVTDTGPFMVTPFAYKYGNFYNRVDILNATAGVHTEFFCHTTVRIGAVVPLRDNFDSDRMFDAEVQVQVNRRF